MKVGLGHHRVADGGDAGEAHHHGVGHVAARAAAAAAAAAVAGAAAGVAAAAIRWVHVEAEVAAIEGLDGVDPIEVAIVKVGHRRISAYRYID